MLDDCSHVAATCFLASVLSVVIVIKKAPACHFAYRDCGLRKMDHDNVLTSLHDVDGFIIC